MLENKVIIYDDSCPMCRLYTYWFVAWGFLKPENRIGFASAPDSITRRVDLDRGRHEIPLFDRSTGETIYGLRAMTFILEERSRWMKPVFRTRLFGWMFCPLYEIITYNRRVIAGCKHCGGYDCAPDLNRFYRSIYLAIVAVVVMCIAVLLMLCSLPAAKIGLAALSALSICGTISGALVRVFSGKWAGWNFAANYATTVLIVALTLAPLTSETIGLSLGEPASWIVLGTAMLLGLGELRRREI